VIDTPAEAIERARRGVSALFFVDGAALGAYVSHLADIQTKLHLTNGQLGRAMMFSAVGAVSTMPLAGGLIHRFGSRTVTLVGATILLAVVPLLALAPSVPLLCLTLYFVGASNGQADVAMNAHSMAVQERSQRPILSAIHGWFSLGGFAGGAGAALVATFGGRPLTHMLISSILLAFAMGWGYRSMLPPEIDRNAEGPKFALPTRQLVLLSVLVLFAFVSEGAMWDWCTVFLRRSLNSGVFWGAFGFGLASFGMAAGRFLGDAWTHRFGYRKLLLVSAAVAGVSLLLALVSGSVVLAILGFAAMGVGVANIVPLLFRAAAGQPGISAGVGLAAVTTVGYTGFLGGPPLIGFVADRTSLRVALSLISFLCLAIAVASRKAVRVIES
jgi:MFS family permease